MLNFSGYYVVVVLLVAFQVAMCVIFPVALEVSDSDSEILRLAVALQPECRWHWQPEAGTGTARAPVGHCQCQRECQCTAWSIVPALQPAKAAKSRG